MMSGYHGNEIFGSQQSFLIGAAICIVEGWKKTMGYRFVPECNHAQESQTFQFFIIISTIFTGPRFVEIHKFCYHGNVRFSSLFLAEVSKM